MLNDAGYCCFYCFTAVSTDEVWNNKASQLFRARMKFIPSPNRSADDRRRTSSCGQCPRSLSPDELRHRPGARPVVPQHQPGRRLDRAGPFPRRLSRRQVPPLRDALAADLSGKSVLDIGCNAGFYSIEMKRRGAGRVARHRQRRSLSRAGAARERDTWVRRYRVRASSTSTTSALSARSSISSSSWACSTISATRCSHST